MRLSLAEAERLALSCSPLVKGAEAQVAGAQAQVKGASAQPNPTLSLTKPFGSGTGGLDEDIYAAQTYELGGKRAPRVRAARGEAAAAAARAAGTMADVRFAVQEAYFEALRADVDRNLAADALATSKTVASAAETQFQAGNVPYSNVVRTQVEVVRAEQALVAAEAERANRYATLRSLTGIPPDTPLMLSDTLSFTPTAYQLPALETLALASRPEVRAARLTLMARQAGVRLARSQQLPDLSVGYRHATLDPTQPGNSVCIGVTFPLLDYGSTRADVEAAQAAVNEQESALAEAERNARLEVATALRTLEAAAQAVESFQTGRLGRAKELLDMAQTGYQMGANSYLELLDAAQVYRTEQAEYARALAAYNEAKAALQRAVGGVLPEGTTGTVPGAAATTPGNPSTTDGR